MEIFSQEVINARKTKVAVAIKPMLKNSDLVLISCGEPIQRPGGLDQNYPFLPHPSYFWITGRRRPSEVIAFDVQSGWIEFQNPISKDEAVWEGGEPSPASSKYTIDQLEDYVKKFEKVYVLGQKTNFLQRFHVAPEELRKVQEQVDLVRRQKDSAEVELIQSIAEMAARGYQHIQSLIRPGLSERDIQIEYEAEIQRAGAHTVPYDTIVGAGTNAAVLHAIPTKKVLNEGELVLIDAGADVYDYCVDITRVYPAGTSFTSQQTDLYKIVKQAQSLAIDSCKVGVQWHEVHTTAANTIASGLKELGILKGEISDILDSGAISIFFPHGVGHLVGLRVRDTGNEENINPKSYCGARLRIDLALQENYLVTVEPGCYFIAPLLQDSELKQKYKDFINFTEAEKWLHVGGVRIEDDILVTRAEPKNLTAMVEKFF